MDPNRFDSLTRSFHDPRSRRGALASLLGGTLGLLGLTEIEGKEKKKKKNKKKPPVPTTQDPVSPPPPPPCVPACAGNQCGPDGCGATCGACTAGAVCQGSQCVNGSLAVGASCAQTLPRACTSGVCGCVGASCACRNQTCVGYLTECVVVADCCDYDCGSTAFGDFCFTV